MREGERVRGERERERERERKEINILNGSARILCITLSQRNTDVKNGCLLNLHPSANAVSSDTVLKKAK